MATQWQDIARVVVDAEGPTTIEWNNSKCAELRIDKARIAEAFQNSQKMGAPMVWAQI